MVNSKNFIVLLDGILISHSTAGALIVIFMANCFSKVIPIIPRNAIMNGVTTLPSIVIFTYLVIMFTVHPLRLDSFTSVAYRDVKGNKSLLYSPTIKVCNSGDVTIGHMLFYIKGIKNLVKRGSVIFLERSKECGPIIFSGAFLFSTSKPNIFMAFPKYLFCPAYGAMYGD